MQTFYPILRYRDARAALAWLSEAFGLEATEVTEGEDGSIAHAELRLGEDVLMLGSDSESGGYGTHAGQGWVYVAVDDPDALHARAAAAGAEVVRELEDTAYGSRDFSVRDPEGNLWSFGTYRPELLS